MPRLSRSVRQARIVDDDANHRWLIREAIENDPSLGLTIVEHAAYEEFLESVSADGDTASVVLLDNRIDNVRGVEVLPDVIRRKIGPVILLTGHGDEETAATAMRDGASDYLVKSRIFEDADILHRSIRAAIERFELERQNAGYEDELLTKNRRLARLYELSQSFVDNVSHEFRTPLAVLKEFNALLLDGIAGELTETQREYVQIMAGKVEDLIIMVNDLLDESRIESGMFGVARTRCSASEIIESLRVTLGTRAASGNVELRIDVPPELPDVYCDPEKIGRALINLVVNAMKFSPENEVVEVAVAAPDAREDCVTFRVIDRGPGIPPEKIEEIFDRFKQVGNRDSATKGFGLGLNIVRELSRLNLSTVSVSSIVGSGSVFTLSVPAYEPQSIVRRYLDRRGELGAESYGVTLIGVDITHEEAARRTETANMLNHSLRPSDLFLPGEDTRYYIVAATADGRTMTRRLREALDAAYRGMPSGRIPTIDFEVLGSWTASNSADAAGVAKQLAAIVQGSEEHVRA